jgi:hypothetical protein
VEEVASALGKEKFDSYRLLERDAKLRALRESGHPFHVTTAADWGGLMSERLQFMKRLSDTTATDLEAGKEAEGRQVVTLLQTLQRRIVGAKEPLMFQLVANSSLGMAIEHLKKFEGKNGRKDKADALQKQLDEAKASRPKTEQFAWTVILYLPVPSLQNELVKRSTDDELGFAREQSGK